MQGNPKRPLAQGFCVTMNNVLYTVIYYSLSAFTWIVMTVVDSAFKFIYGRGISVPPVDNPVLLLPANELTQKIRSRELRAFDVMEAYIARVRRVNAQINAVVADQFEEALKKANDLDQVLDSLSAQEIEDRFPRSEKLLLGVPLSVKEAFAWTGMPNSSGVPDRRHIRSTYDAPVLANLQAAGAIPFIMTNVSEACMWFESSNYVYGCTNNAYDNTRMVGGSSGGEGCILSSGASLIGIGSDIGGSIRMPCFFNGIFGHKPSIGIVENRGQFPIASKKAMDLLATGPMCRYATDLIPVLKAMAGPEKVALLKLDTQVEMQKLRVISVPDDGGSLMVSSMDPQLVKAQREVARFLQSKGAQVSETAIKKFRLSLEMWTAKMNLADDGPSFACILSGLVNEKEGKGHVNCFKEFGKRLINKSEHTLPAIALGVVDDYLPKLTKSRDLTFASVLDKLRTEICELLGENGVLLYPSHPKVAPYHNHPIFTPFNFAYTGLFNALGLPVTQVPLGLSEEGLPLGVQVATTPFNDHLSLAVANVLEEGFGGWVNPGSVR